MSASRKSAPSTRPPPFDAEVAWETIKIGMGKNLTTPETEKPMDMKEYMAHYTAIHNVCLQTKVVRNNFSAKNDGGANLLGGDLYMHLRDFLTEHLQDVRKGIIQRDDGAILKRYLQEWKQYHTGAHRNAKLMSYLNRHWCLREIDEGNPGVHEIYPSHIILWDEIILDDSQDIVREVIVGLVEKKRSGEAVDEELVGELLEASRWRLVDGVLVQGSSASGTAGFEEENKLGKVIPDIYQLLLDLPTGETDEQILFRAVQRSYKPTISYLFTHHPFLSPDTKDSAGRTPLSHAAYNADTALILFLLSSGANVNVQDNDGVAPLTWAVRQISNKRKIESVVELLLEKGADVEAKDGQGYTALDWAKKDKSFLNRPVVKALEDALGPAKLAAYEEEAHARADESE